MAEKFDISVSGKDATNDVVTPVNGKSGHSLGEAGNGAPGKESSKFPWGECEQQAGPGQPGEKGDTAPPAPAGANGKDAYDVTIICNEYSGPTLTVRNKGGDGGPGSSGGKGGDGGPGGNAGKQPCNCKDVVPGGIGGHAGGGGNAGAGGDGGGAGDVVVVVGSGLDDGPVSVTSIGGKTGIAGRPGMPGNPGKGGKNSDGTTADPGGTGGPGGYPAAPTAGYGGSFSQTTDTSKPPNFLKLAVYKHKAG